MQTATDTNLSVRAFNERLAFASLVVATVSPSAGGREHIPTQIGFTSNRQVVGLNGTDRS
jgi:hypothetical protein